MKDNVSFSLTHLIVTPRIKQKNDGYDLERTALKSTFEALSGYFEELRNKEKESNINETKRNKNALNEY